MRRALSILLVFQLSMLAWGHTEWLGVYIKGKKAGYISYIDRADGAGKYSESVSVIDGKMLGFELSIKSTSKTWVDSKGQMTRTEYETVSGGRTQNVIAIVSSGGVDSTSTMDGRTTKKHVAIPTGAILADDPIMPFLKGEAPKDVYVFDPNTLDLVLVKSSNKGSETIETPKGKVSAQVIKLEDPRAPMTIYVGSKGDFIKADGPFGMEIRPVSKEEALSVGEGADIADASSIVPDKPLEDFLSLKSLMLELSGKDLSFLPSDGNQTVTKIGLNWKVDIYPIQPEKTTPKPSVSTDQKWLASDIHIPSETEKFRKKSKEIVGSSIGFLERVEKIRKYVYARVRANGGIGVLRDADDVLDSAEGVCRDHAILMATLLRAGKIPTKLVSGLVYGNDAFYYHAWVEVWTGSEWLGVDSTRPSSGLDATHIKIAEGSVSGAFTSFLLDGVKIHVLSR